MKTAVILLVAVGMMQLQSVGASAPRGTVLELHSCEVYAGGCLVSSEATMGGRCMVRAWRFADGVSAGVDLAGLQVAVLQCASQNLASAGTKSDQAVIYYPSGSTDAQQRALRAWVEAQDASLKRAILAARTVPLEFKSTAQGYAFSAGDAIRVETAPLESCETGACGEALWYRPRAAANVFTVAVNHASEVKEPLLKFTWTDAGKRSVFLAKFGGSGPADLFVSTAEVCGPSGRLF